MDAIIYCRVSSQKQVEQGHGLDAQMNICRKFAQGKYTIIREFIEPGISGSTLDRPVMQEMIAYLKANKGTVVIFDELSRMTRDVGGWLELVQIVKDCNATFDSPKHTFDNTEENDFLNTLLVLTGELQRKQNKRQVIQKMRARLESGFWVFPACPLGYKIKKFKEHGKMPAPVEPTASIVRETLEGFANDRFITQADVMRFFQQQKIYSKPKVEHVSRILARASFYAGFVEYEPWGVKLTQGKHEPIISFATYQRIQKKLEATGRVYERNYNRPAFPLRGYVSCSCGKLYTASKSKGRKEMYSYYLCYNRECSFYGKSIRAQDMEADFTKLLKRISPTPKMLALSQANLQKRWEERLKNLQAFQTRLNKNYSDIETQIERLAMRAASTTSEVAARAYEKRMDELEKERLTVKEEMTNYVDENLNFRTALERVTEYFNNPLERWNSGDLEGRRKLLNMVFNKNIVYDRTQGFRTADLSLTYAIISGNKQLNSAVNSDSGHGASILEPDIFQEIYRMSQCLPIIPTSGIRIDVLQLQKSYAKA